MSVHLAKRLVISGTLNARPLDLERNPEIRRDFGDFLAVSSTEFPNLSTQNWEAVKPPSDNAYNCVAASIGRRDVMLMVGPDEKAYDNFYKKHGYSPCDVLDLSCFPKFLAIVLYAKLLGEDGRHPWNDIFPWPPNLPYITHAIGQGEDGGFYSKMGTYPEIRILDPEVLSGPSYGPPFKCYLSNITGDRTEVEAGRRKKTRTKQF